MVLLLLLLFFYCNRLGFHYKHGTNGRKDAFKYELKAASHCVSRGAFSDALIFINSAADLAEDTREYKLLLHVINYGLKTLGVRQGPFSSLYSLLSRALTKHNQFLDSEDFYLSESNSAFVDVETMMQSTAPPPTYSSVPRGTPVSRGIAEHRNGNNVSGGARTVDAYKRVKAKVERLLSNCIKDKNSSTNSISGPVSAPGRGSCFSPRLFRGDDFTSSGDSQRGWSSNLRSKSRSKKATGRPELGLTPEAIVEGEEDHAGGASAATVTTKTTSSTSATGTGGGPAAEATASEVQTPQKGAAMAAERDGSPVLDDHREVASQFSVSSTGSNDAIPLPPLTPRESADGCGLRCSCVVS